MSLLVAGLPTSALAGPATLDFDEVYSAVSVLGMTFSDKVQGLAGRPVSMRGFMAPPLKAEAQFFVLTSVPTALCPFCSSDADWPDNIVVVYLHERQTFVQFNAPIEVTGTLEVGSWTMVVLSRTLSPRWTSATRSLTTSQPRSLLSMAVLNIARSRTRPSCWRRVRIAQMCFGLSGGFGPTIRP